MHENGMILIGEYLRGRKSVGASGPGQDGPGAAHAPSALLAAYRDAIETMGRCGVEISSAEGAALLEVMETVSANLEQDSTEESVSRAGKKVHDQLIAWGHGMARHLEHRTSEVKEMLLVLARSTQRAGERDQRCARHIEAITHKLHAIASYDDLPLMRESILAAAEEIRKSISTILDESNAELSELRAQMAASRDRLQEAERVASLDSLTQLPNRFAIEKEIARRMEEGRPFSIGLIDIDDFKTVNDNHGHLIGDEILRQFGGELRNSLRSTDVAGRWGGDEWVMVLDCPLAAAQKLVERVSTWVCGNYLVGALRLCVTASIGAAEYVPGETMQQLLKRADEAMYRRKRPQ
jgi:diguanylate cyclase (GGDEF)-like protein